MITMRWADDWQDHPDCPHRVVFGHGRVVQCRDGGEVTVSTSRIQFSDGSIDIGGLIETPAVQIDQRPFSSDARQLAAAIIGPSTESTGGCSDDHHRTPPLIPRAAGVELLFQVLTEREERSVIAIAPTSHSLPGQRHSLTRDCALRLLTC